MCNVNFAQDPLRSYFDDPQLEKKKISSLIFTVCFTSVSFIICEHFINILQNKQQRNVIKRCVWLLRSAAVSDMTSVEHYVGQSSTSFMGDVAYA